MAGITYKNFASPDESKSLDKFSVELVDLGSAVAAKITQEPGWSWSKYVKPLAGTDSCQVRHVGVMISGRVCIRHDDGTEVMFVPGDAYVIEPGHDAWVVGDEPAVGYEFENTQPPKSNT